MTKIGQTAMGDHRHRLGRGRRLEHCRNDLLDPRYARTSIGAIAARWGLFDSSYFSRLFKTVYGAAP
jgi:AraC-like DNA-binding protein